MTENTETPPNIMQGKVALVTGASGGIGAEVVKQLCQNGCIVIATDNNTEQLNMVTDDLKGQHYTVDPYTVDVRSAESIDHLITTIIHKWGSINYLVNAAGVLTSGPISELSVDDWNNTLQVNATGVFLMSQAVAKHMQQCTIKGSIVTVASNASLIARMNMAAYSASKAAATAFTKCLGLEVAKYGIRCNIVAPGSTDTPMLKALWGDSNRTEETLQGSLSNFRAGIPLQTLATPEKIANTVAYLLSDQASHITMQTLTVDGGATLGV